jgi:hypothetical protein
LTDQRILVALFEPLGDLVFLATQILIERNFKLLDQVGTVALDEPGHVFTEVLAGLGHKVTQPYQHLVAHPVPVADTVLPNHGATQRVQVFAIMLESEVECPVVDPSAQVVDLFDEYTDVVSKLSSSTQPTATTDYSP